VWEVPVFEFGGVINVQTLSSIFVELATAQLPSLLLSLSISTMVLSVVANGLEYASASACA
jgi:hypothetical protein